MNSKNSLCLLFFLLLFSFIFVADAFNVKLTSTIKQHDNLKDSIYSFHSFDKSLKQNQYIIEPYNPLNLCQLEKKCKMCKPKPPEKPKPKCFNKPITCCNKNKQVPENKNGKFCSGSGSCVRWAAGNVPDSISYEELAKIWNEANPGGCTTQNCISALYNARRNTGQDNKSPSVPVSYNDDPNKVGLFGLSNKSIINSSPNTKYQASVPGDLCKQSFIKQQQLLKGCKDNNWKTPTKADQADLHNNRDFQKGIAICHNK
tara:strand:+ start:2821 stop:3597 length:777 start_codon:yes stop_codon:yes gene_type:complete